MTTSPATASNPRDRTPYSTEQLQQALDSLLSRGEDDPRVGDKNDDDAAHIFGHGDPDHRLSMLQVITATRILDYQKQEEVEQSDDTASSSSSSTKKRDRSDILNLRDVIQGQAPVMALAAEFKRASPSKGQIATTDITNSAAEQAVRYGTAGACIVSVLTEPRWFQGSLKDLQDVRAATNDLLRTGRDGSMQRPAILRKDFCISTRMIDEAVDAGADTILLIVAVLPRAMLRSLISYCRDVGMEPLVEVHTDHELRVAVSCGAKVIGINNRNLHTFHLDMNTSTRIASTLDRIIADESKTDPTVPRLSRNDFTLCALSGMSTADDVDMYRQSGIEMCLIGESLMRATSPSQLIADLCLDPEEYRKKKLVNNHLSAENGASHGSASGTAASAPWVDGLKLVKVCGITNVDDAMVACRAGANLIGIIFAEKSPRKVASSQQAIEIVQAVRRFGERDDRLDFSSVVPDTGDGSSSPVDALKAKAQILVNATRRTPGVVGVFQNQDLQWIRSVVDECGLDLVQLHGKEGMKAANATNFGGVPALRVVDIPVDDAEPDIPISNDEGVESKLLQSVTCDPLAILLDTSIKGQGAGGGTGKAFDWTVASRLQEAGLPVIVAGGLSPDTVSDCCARIRPLGVDVSSGVEAKPGVKDHDKVTRFVHAARQAA